MFKCSLKVGGADKNDKVTSVKAKIWSTSKMKSDK